MRLVGEPKKTKKRKEERKTPKHCKLAIRPDHPRRRIRIKLCMLGGLWSVVIRVKCDPNRLRVYGAVRGRKCPFPITLASGSYNSLYYCTSRDFGDDKVVAERVGCCADVAQKWPGSSAAVDRCGRTRPIQCGRVMTSSWWLVEAGVRALQRPTCRAVTVQTAPTSTTRAPTVWPLTSVPVTTRTVIHWFHPEELSGVTAPSGESVRPSVCRCSYFHTLRALDGLDAQF